MKLSSPTQIPQCILTLHSNISEQTDTGSGGMQGRGTCSPLIGLLILQTTVLVLSTTVPKKISIPVWFSNRCLTPRISQTYPCLGHIYMVVLCWKVTYLFGVSRMLILGLRKFLLRGFTVFNPAQHGDSVSLLQLSPSILWRSALTCEIDTIF